MKKILSFAILFVVANNLATAQVPDTDTDTTAVTRASQLTINKVKINFDHGYDAKKILTAIGDAEFGMTWEEALKCDIFNQRKPKFNRYAPRRSDKHLDALNFELGNYEYTVKCLFRDDLLDEVTIMSRYVSASEWDNALNRYYMNLKGIFTRAYGEPTLNPTYPNILEYEHNPTIWIYGFEKAVSLSIKREGYKYYVYVSIDLINEKTIDRMEKDLDELIEKENKSSELF